MSALRVMMVALALTAAAWPARAQDPVGDCDRLAAHPYDLERVGPGVVLVDMDGAAAAAACRQAVAREPDNLRLRFQLGRAFYRLEDFADARAAYEIAAAGIYPPAMTTLGIIHASGLGVPVDEVEAVRWYRRAANHGDPSGQFLLADMFAHGQGGLDQDLDEAARLFRLAADQGHGGAAYQLGLMYRLGHGVDQDLPEAERLYRAAIDSGDRATLALARIELALLLTARGQDLEEATELAAQAIAAEPADARFLGALGWIQLRRGQLPQAAESFEGAIALAPEDPRLHDNLGDVYAALHDLDAARAAWQRALDLPPPDPAQVPGWDPAAIERKLAATAPT